MSELSTQRLGEIAALADQDLAASRPNVEHLRACVGELVDFTAHLLEEDMKHLALLELKRGCEAVGEDRRPYLNREAAQTSLQSRREQHAALIRGRAGSPSRGR